MKLLSVKETRALIAAGKLKQEEIDIPEEVIEPTATEKLLEITKTQGDNTNAILKGINNVLSIIADKETKVVVNTPVKEQKKRKFRLTPKRGYDKLIQYIDIEEL